MPNLADENVMPEVAEAELSDTRIAAIHETDATRHLAEGRGMTWETLLKFASKGLFLVGTSDPTNSNKTEGKISLYFKTSSPPDIFIHSGVLSDDWVNILADHTGSAIGLKISNNAISDTPSSEPTDVAASRRAVSTKTKELADDAITSDERNKLSSLDPARMLPGLPSAGDRDNKVLKFNGNTLGWEISDGGNRTYYQSSSGAGGGAPQASFGNVGDTYIWDLGDERKFFYEKTGASTWTRRVTLHDVPSYPASGSRDGKILKFSGDTIGWVDDTEGGEGLTPDQEAAIEALKRKGVDLHVETAEAWVPATASRAQFQTISGADLTSFSNRVAPSALTGWTNDKTISDEQVIVVRIRAAEVLDDYRLLIGTANTRLDAYVRYTSDSEWVYYASPVLHRNTGRIQLQYHGEVDHTSYSGRVTGERALPALPAEGSRDNKVAQFDGDNLIWQVLTGGGTGITEAQVARLLPTLPNEGDRNLKIAQFVNDVLTWKVIEGFVTEYDFEHRRNHTPNRVSHLPVRLEPQEQTILVSDGHWSDEYYQFVLAEHDVTISGNTERYIGVNTLAFSTELPVFGNTGLPSIFRANRIAAIYARYLDGSSRFNIKIIIDKALIPTIPDPSNPSNMIPDFAGFRLGYKSPGFGSRSSPLTQTAFFSDEPGQSLSENEMTVGGKTYVALTPTLDGTSETETRVYNYSIDMHNVFSNRPVGEATIEFHISYLDSRTPTAVETATYLSDDLNTPWASSDEYPAGLYEGDVNGHPIAAALPSKTLWDHVVARSNTYFSGTSPDNAAGVDGQFWVNLRTGQIHQKQSGTWTLITDVALQTEISRAIDWSSIPNNTQIPANFMTKHSNRYFGSKTTHVKTSGSAAPTGDATNWIELSNPEAQLPTFPATGSRDNKAAVFDGDNLVWETLMSGGLTSAQLARLLPALPAEGSRDDKIAKFSGNTLQWEDDTGGTPPDASITLAKLAQEVKDSINAQASIGSFFDGLSDPLSEGWLSNVTGKWSATEHAWGVIGSPGSSSNNDRNNPLYQSNEQIDWEKAFSFRYRLTFKRPAGASNQSGSFQTFWGGNAFTTVPSWIGALTEGMGFWCNRVRTETNVLEATYDNYLFFGLLVPTTVTGNPARLFGRWLSTAPSHTTLYNGALRTSASSPARAIGTTFRDSNFGFFVPETSDECDINIIGFGAYVYLFVNNTLYARIDTSDIGNLDFGPRFGWMGDATGVDGAQALLHEAIVGSPDPINVLPRQNKMELPTFPAIGSRNDKILRFADDVLGWEDLAAASGADGKVLYGSTVPAGSLGKVGDTYFRTVTNAVGIYEKTGASTWTFKYEVGLRSQSLPTLPAQGSRDDKILRFDGNTLGWEDLSMIKTEIGRGNVDIGSNSQFKSTGITMPSGYNTAGRFFIFEVRGETASPFLISGAELGALTASTANANVNAATAINVAAAEDRAARVIYIGRTSANVVLYAANGVNLDATPLIIWDA